MKDTWFRALNDRLIHLSAVEYFYISDGMYGEHLLDWQIGASICNERIALCTFNSLDETKSALLVLEQLLENVIDVEHYLQP